MYHQNWNTLGTDFPLADFVKHADTVSESEYMTQIQSYMIYTAKDKKQMWWEDFEVNCSNCQKHVQDRVEQTASL